MLKTKKIATNIPADLMNEATRLTGFNQTQALVAGLEELIAKRKRELLLSLRGKVRISVDTNRTRNRKKA